MAEAALLYEPRVQFIDSNGDPLSGGKLYTYEPGTSTPKAAYTDQALTTPHANPIILDANGSAEVWLDGIYKINLTDSADVQISGYPVDDFSTAPAATVDVSGGNEWLTTGDVPTFVSATQFTVPNDRTSVYEVGRRTKNTVTAGTVYGRVTVSSFAASITTVTVVIDSGNLDSGLSAVDVGILTAINPSIPKADVTLSDVTADDVIAATLDLSGTLDVDGIATMNAQVRWSKGADVASASALTLGTDGNSFDITGTDAITSIDTLGIGTLVALQFDGILTLTHDATDLILPDGNITTAAGDVAVFYEYAAGDWRMVSYSRVQAILTEELIKGWVTFDGGTFGIDDSFNVSSMDDDGTGTYTVNWDTDFANADYAVIGCANNNDFVGHEAATIAVGSVVIKVFDDTGTSTDNVRICIMAIGDQ